MLKISLAQIEVRPGRPSDNAAVIIDAIIAAKKAGSHLVIFPEMAVPGYLLGDTWESSSFLADCETANARIVAATKEYGLAVIFGSVALDSARKNYDGRVRKYNAFFTAQDGRLLKAPNDIYSFSPKTLLPNYREFDDSRYFFGLRELAFEKGLTASQILHPLPLTIDGKTYQIGRLICEDSWQEDYDFDVAAALAENAAADGKKLDLFVNISSSPFTLGKNDKRHRVFKAAACHHATPVIYVNHVGLQNNGKTVYTFDGDSTVYAGDGSIALATPPYAEGIYNISYEAGNLVVDPALKKTPPTAPKTEIASIFSALDYGIKKFLSLTGIKKVVIGVSGGIDSAVTAALYANILPRENLLLLNLPSRYNSATTKNLARELATNLGCLYAVAPIEESVALTVRQLAQTFPAYMDAAGKHIDPIKLPVSDFICENIQARDRSARILAAFAAAFGGAFTCNANKAELTAGYSTLYGDQAGFFAALADLWKHQVYALAHYLNKTVFGREVIPPGTINVVPSAELSSAQDVEAGQGDPLVYPYHDYLFRAFIERWDKATPFDILRWYAEGTIDRELGCADGITRRLFPTAKEFIADLEHWWQCYSGLGVAKRIQAPPVLAVSRRAYGFDHRESQNGVYYTLAYKELKEKLLAATE